jgi:heme o synthase
MTTLLTTAEATTKAAASLGLRPEGVSSRPSMLSSYLVLTKARLTALVLVTTAVGYVAGMRQVVDFSGFIGAIASRLREGKFGDAWSAFAALLGTAELRTLWWTVLGTGLAACSASVLNQLMEVRRDAAMIRTQRRPLPMGHVSRGHAFVLGIVLAYAGVSVLGLKVSGLAAGLALANVALYVLIYTPMKPRTTLNTLVGAVCGAVPPMIGWAAATGGLERGAWVLGGILFVWQIPHFLALAWMYREDYERGGFRMLPRVDGDAHVTTSVSVITALLLAPLCLAGLLTNVGGFIFAAGGVLLSLWLTWLTVRFYKDRSTSRARGAFFGSIVYLPLLMLLIVIDPTGLVRPRQGDAAVVVQQVGIGVDGGPVVTDSQEVRDSQIDGRPPKVEASGARQ